MAIAARYTPVAIPYSIDEAFLDFAGIPGDLTETCRHLRATVLQELGLPTSVGLAGTKTLAKLANHVAKTCDRKPGVYGAELSARLAQVCNFAQVSAQELDRLMAATDVGDVWGVGRKIAERLRAGGVTSVLDLVRADVASLRREFSVVLEKTVLELRGTACLSVEEAPAAKQQILVSRSFGKPVTDVDAVVEAVSEFASRAAERLRQQDSLAGAIQVFIATSPFRSNDRQHCPSVTVPLRPTADSRHLVRAAVCAAREMFRPGFNYAKAGCMLLDLQDRAAASRQAELDLFAEAEPATPAAARGRDRGALMEAVDSLNRRFGRGAVRIGSATSAKANDSGAATWSVKQDRRTPRYTTRWDEMPIVRC
jgi:DNA polymerase V